MAIIYEAVNIVNQKRYVGFTSNTIENRKKQHMRDSKRYGHLKFTRAILKYGIDGFVFNVLEESENAEWLLLHREPYWINTLNTTDDLYGYNICSGGRGRTGCIPWNKGIPHNDEAKRKMSESTRGHIQSAETITKRNAKLRGQRRTDTTRRRMSSTWEIITPEGKSLIIQNLQQFCRDHNLTSPCMIAVANGKRVHHKQYKCKRIKDGPQSRRQTSA